jgi:hypothetical protein
MYQTMVFLYVAAETPKSILDALVGKLFVLLYQRS